MPEDSPDFATWLRGALSGRPNVFIVKRSGTKQNGRPVIDDSRVSKWLKGQKPSMENASLVARILGQPESDALVAAGYTYGHSLRSIERIHDERPVGGGGEDPGYVAAPGEAVEQSVTDKQVLEQLRAIRNHLDELSAGQGELREDVNALSRRVARIESAAEPMGGLDGPV